MGLLVGAELNRARDRGLRATVKTASAAGMGAALSLLLFAIEGAICILIIVPLALPLVLTGAAVGRQAVLLGARRGGSVAACLILPVMGALERDQPPAPLHHVTTSVDVAAPPEVVFEHVISFPPIEETGEWLFRTGIAVPLSARIEGHGVGAVRHCEFSTGSFVEPITHWEPGERLAFDVIASPPPMEEWSLYRHLHPPHLDSSMRSRRGEFRLIRLPGGGTRLEGHTHYELGLMPDAYFAVFADAIVHRIHRRVLEHVAALAERDERARLVSSRSPRPRAPR
jgi:hypothetical protein